MSTAVNTENDPLAGLHKWQAYLAQLQQDLQDMQAQCVQDQQEINDLQNQLNNANNNYPNLLLAYVVALLTGNKDQIAQAKAALDAGTNLINSLTGKVSDAKNKLAQDTKAVADYQTKYASFLQDSTSSSNANSSVNQMIQQSEAQTDASSAQKHAMDSQTDSGDQTAEESRQNALKSVASALDLDESLSADAIQRIENCKNDINDINADVAEEKVLKDKIIEDSIKLAVCCCCFGIGAAHYARALAEDCKELNDTKNDESAKRADLTVQQNALKSDMAEMKTLDVGDLNKMIDDLFDTVGKLISLIGKDGKVSEGGMQQASVLIAEVMSIVAMITTKVHQLRSADEQWMARINAADSEIGANASKITIQHLAELEEFASFMKTTMQVAQYGAEVATGVMALASGGALAIAMAAIMIYLSQSGLFQKMTEGLAQKMSSNGAVWAKVLADVTVAVATVVVTHSAAGIESGLAESLSSASAEETAEATAEVSAEIEIEMASLTSKGAQAASENVADVSAEVEEEEEVVIQNVSSKGAEAAQGAGKTLGQRFIAAVQRFASGLKEEMSQNLTWGKTLGMTGLYFGSANGVVDLAEFGLAFGTGQAGANEKQLEKDEAQILMILKIVAAVVQAIAEVGCGGKVMGGESEVSMLERLFGQMESASTVTQVAYTVQNLSSFAGALASGGLASNSYTKGQLTEMLGKAQAELTATQAIGQQAKLFEKKEIELFASKLKQEIEGVEMLVKKAGQPEMEAAKVLEQTAV